jgi:hypothetical protein
MATLSRTAADTQRMTEDYGTSKWVEREVAHSRRVIANAKLVVTFSAALAATFVAQFMGKEHQEGFWDEVGLVLMVLTLFYTIRVILLRHGAHEGDMGRDVFENAKQISDKAHKLMVKQVVLSILTVAAVICQLRL